MKGNKMFLFMLPADPGGNAIDTTVAPVEFVVDSPATYNGAPIEISNGVTLKLENGFTVTLSPTAIAPAESVETDAEYQVRICNEYYDVKPWMERDCPN
jgi:hypothetical protein